MSLLFPHPVLPNKDRYGEHQNRKFQSAGSESGENGTRREKIKGLSIDQ